jgi:hypothetical protein
MQCLANPPQEHARAPNGRQIASAAPARYVLEIFRYDMDFVPVTKCSPKPQVIEGLRGRS